MNTNRMFMVQCAVNGATTGCRKCALSKICQSLNGEFKQQSLTPAAEVWEPLKSSPTHPPTTPPPSSNAHTLEERAAVRNHISFRAEGQQTISVYY